jgi:hypothetical protein
MNQDEISAKALKGTFYYDIISPFSYFYIKQRYRLDQRVAIEPVPILLGGLFRATDNRGPGEVEAKRPHTYQYCVWLAEKLGLPFRFPEHHPFLTVAAQRLLVQENANWEMVERAFEYVWVEGKDPNLSWPEFCQHLGLSADIAMNSRSKAFAESLAKVVLPTPGGPQRIIECSLPEAKARLRGLPEANRWVCPMTSSMHVGRKASAKGGGGA